MPSFPDFVLQIWSQSYQGSSGIQVDQVNQNEYINQAAVKEFYEEHLDLLFHDIPAPYKFFVTYKGFLVYFWGMGKLLSIAQGAHDAIQSAVLGASDINLEVLSGSRNWTWAFVDAKHIYQACSLARNGNCLCCKLLAPTEIILSSCLWLVLPVTKQLTSFAGNSWTNAKDMCKGDKKEADDK